MYAVHSNDLYEGTWFFFFFFLLKNKYLVVYFMNVLIFVIAPRFYRSWRYYNTFCCLHKSYMNAKRRAKRERESKSVMFECELLTLWCVYFVFLVFCALCLFDIEMWPHHFSDKISFLFSADILTFPAISFFPFFSSTMIQSFKCVFEASR